MDKKKTVVAIASIIVITVSVGLLAIIQLKNFKTGEKKSDNDKLGMCKIESVISPEQNGNSIISRQLGYKFRIPEGYEISEIGTADSWNATAGYVEFAAQNREKNTTIHVSITPMDGDEFKNSGTEFDSRRLVEAIYDQTFLKFAKPLLAKKDLGAMSCWYYEGLSNRTKADGTNVYVASYTYLAPYVGVSYMVITDEACKEEIANIFHCFEALE